MAGLFDYMVRERDDAGYQFLRYDREAAGDFLARAVCKTFLALGDKESALLLSESYHYIDGDGFDEEREIFWSYTWTISCPDNVYVQLATPELVRDFTEKVNRLGLPAMEPVEQIIAVAHNDLGDDWRNKVFAQLGRSGVNNQGNVWYENQPSILHDELRFRTKDEVNVYDALMRHSIPFMPLPVVMRPNQAPRPDGISRRMEPDFVLIYRGRSVFVEIDGSSHKETPAKAEARLQFLREQGILVRRLESASVSDLEKALTNVKQMLKSIDREIAARP